MSVLNPKVSVLEKLAVLVQDCIRMNEHTVMSGKIEGILQDSEVLDWLQGMVELKYVPERHKESAGQRVGYQICATDSSGQEVASYAEAVSVDEALEKCVAQFPIPEYSSHRVKNIDTQKYSYLHAQPVSLSLEDL